jgi:hypothetical protein
MIKPATEMICGITTCNMTPRASTSRFQRTKSRVAAWQGRYVVTSLSCNRVPWIRGITPIPFRERNYSRRRNTIVPRIHGRYFKKGSIVGLQGRLVCLLRMCQRAVAPDLVFEIERMDKGWSCCGDLDNEMSCDG